MKRILTNTERNVSVGLCLIFLCFIIYRNVSRAMGLTLNEYGSFQISDFLINYQGGFVRRGLLGELLYQLFLIHPYSLIHAVLCGEFVVFGAFLLLSFKVFYNKGWMPIMPLALIVTNVLDYRRDFLMMLLAYAVFACLFSYLRRGERDIHRLVAAILLCSLSILLYEPFFFFTVPVCMLLYWQNIKRTNSLLGDALKVGGIFLLPLLTMAAVCLAKGDDMTAERIWESWEPLFDYHDFHLTQMAQSINFLKYPTEKVMAMHIDLNYGIGEHQKWGMGFKPSLVLGVLLLFIGVFFLTIKTPRRKEYNEESNILLGELFLFQFISLLPMFTVLSCDFARTILYLVYTSYFIVYMIEENSITCHIPLMHTASARLYRLCSKKPWLSSLWLYVLVLLLLPFPPAIMWVSVMHPLILDYIHLGGM